MNGDGYCRGPLGASVYRVETEEDIKEEIAISVGSNGVGAGGN